MAGKKGAAVALQLEVNSDDDWHKVIEKEGLVVVDIYSEWCGPCLGMVSNLKKLKLEIGSDYLHLAIAKSDNVEILARFREKSEPTWMFIASGHMVNLMFGANAPRLMKMITQELDRELKAIKGERERQTIPFNELTQEEKDRAAETLRKEQEEKEREAREIATALEDLKIRNLTRFAKMLVDKTVMLYFPHMIDDQGTCSAAFKMLAQFDAVLMSVYDQMEVHLTKENLNDIFYNCDIKLPDSLLELMAVKPCLVSLLMHHGSPHSDSGTSLPIPLGMVEEKFATFVYGHLSHTEPPVAHTVAYNFQETRENGEVWPGVWTPLNYLNKASAIRTMFPNVSVTLEFKEEVMPPPRYCVIFEANRAPEVFEVVDKYSDEVINIGYFDGTDPTTAKKVAKSYKKLERLGTEKMKQIKMVMAVTKIESDPLLEFSQLTPLYISPDTKVGSKECDLFFPPPDVFADEKEEESEEEEEEGEEEEEEEVEDIWEGMGLEEGEEEEEGEGGYGDTSELKFSVDLSSHMSTSAAGVEGESEPAPDQPAEEEGEEADQAPPPAE